MVEDGIVSDALMGDVWPAAHPGSDAADYGSVSIDTAGPFEVRSFQTVRLTYRIGRFGLDDTGGLKLVERFTNDGGPLQVEEPTAINYVTAHASNQCRLVVVPEPLGHQRPWDRSLRILVDRGSMAEGDEIVIVLGDRSAGSPGMRMQTFCERRHEFRLLVDPCATGHFFPLEERPYVEIVAGPPARWKAVMPTHARPGERVWLGLKAEDLWGNPSHQAGGPLRLEAEGPLAGLPDRVNFPAGERALRLDGLVAASEGEARVRVLDDGGRELCRSNPLVVREHATGGFWADLHGQSGETVGVNTAAEYFAFGRDLAFLDAMSHQANDFQVTNAFWHQLNGLTAELNRDGRFVAFPGYEWSGNTPVGGDHNVFFRHEGRPIRRSSHALLAERDDIGDDVNSTPALFAALADEDCVVYSHVGGRPADLAKADGGLLRTAVEVHSDWGTFEWILKDSFALGYRLGVVANSDGHKGRPGASYPGAASFGAYGGLTCFLTENLSRDGIFEAMRRRHHYATTGSRIFLDVRARFPDGAILYPRDPRYAAIVPLPVREAMMGDIVATEAARLMLEIEVASPDPIRRVDILRGPEEIAGLDGYEADALGNRVRVTFHGAEYRGRGRQTRWRGRAGFSAARIRGFARINAWNHDRHLAEDGDRAVGFDLLTTGNFCGFDCWLDRLDGTLAIETDHVEGTLDLAGLGMDPVILPAGGLERAVRIQRLPERMERTRISAGIPVDLLADDDNPIWVRVATEEGFTAWSSPIYAVRGPIR